MAGKRASPARKGASHVRDDVPLHRKFGYKVAQEKAAIREELIAEGYDPDDFAPLYFATESRYVERHKNDPTLRQRQEAARAAAPPRPALTTLVLTDEERDHLRDLFEGANHPLSVAIRDKLHP